MIWPASVTEAATIVAGQTGAQTRVAGSDALVSLLLYLLHLALPASSTLVKQGK